MNNEENSVYSYFWCLLYFYSWLLSILFVIIIIAYFNFTVVFFFTINTFIIISILLHVAKFTFWIFDMFLLFATIYPTIFLMEHNGNKATRAFVCYPCHCSSFAIYLTLSSVLIKLLFWRSYVIFYLLYIILCNEER